MRITQRQVNELTSLYNNNSNIEDILNTAFYFSDLAIEEEIVDNDIYKAMYHERILTLEDNISISPKVCIWLAYMAALSPSIWFVDLSNIGLGEGGIPVAQALARSKSITDVYLTNNNFDQHIPTIAKILVRSAQITFAGLFSNIDEDDIGLNDEELAELNEELNMIGEEIKDMLICREALLNKFSEVSFLFPELNNLVVEYAEKPLIELVLYEEDL